jgi:hypothetical protein
MRGAIPPLPPTSSEPFLLDAFNLISKIVSVELVEFYPEDDSRSFIRNVS